MFHDSCLSACLSLMSFFPPPTFSLPFLSLPPSLSHSLAHSLIPLSPSLCRDIQECYRTLAMYKLPVAEEEQQWCGELEPQWKDLAAKARQRDRDIIPDKRRFTVVHTYVTLCQTESSPPPTLCVLCALSAPAPSKVYA